MLNDFEITEKLYDRCGPVLQYRIATELMDKPQHNTEELIDIVLLHPEVQVNIEHYANGARQGMNYLYRKMIHGSKPELLENAVGKLWSLGIRKGVSDIDELLNNYIAIIAYDFYRGNHMRVGYGIYQISQLLGLLGYANEERISPILQARLDQVYSFIEQGCFDIYVDIKDYPRPPANWKEVKKIIDPALTQYGGAEGEPPLPSIYDMFGMIGMKMAGLTPENERKVDAIIQYCFDERYQKGIMPGYGILLAPTGQYYGMGWSVHLPGFGEKLNPDMDIKKLLLWADMLSCFGISRSISLFKELLDFADNYRDKDGFYSFPRKFIPEERLGYFVLGKHMGLGENRRQKEACSNESTFRILRIKKNLGLFK